MLLLTSLILAALCLSAAEKIHLPPGAQPEGVTHAAGSAFFAADLRSGAIFLVDTATGLVTTAVPKQVNRTSVGIYASNGVLFAAGGASPPFLYAYDIPTGSTLAACHVPGGGLVNDVFVDRNFAYYTDSAQPFVYRLRVDKLSTCRFDRIPLPRGDFTSGGDPLEARANGIVTYAGGLVVANSMQATLYFVDLAAGSVRRLLPEGTMRFPDGLEIARGKQTLLYVAQPADQLVSVWRLSSKKGKVRVRFVKDIRSRDFDEPTTVAVAGRTLVTANSGFLDFPPGDPVPPEATFSVGVEQL